MFWLVGGEGWKGAGAWCSTCAQGGHWSHETNNLG